MKIKIFKELLINKSYILITFAISLLTILPNIILSPTIKVTIVMVIAILILILISKFSKVVFIFFISYINISNIMIVHTAIHWGYKNADITPRLYAMSLSPAYESIEYLNNYLDYRDLLLGLYILFIIYLIYKYISVCKHTFNLVKRISFISTIMLVSVLTYIPYNLSKTFDEVPYRFNKEPFNMPLKCLKFLNEPRTKELLARKEYMSHSTFNIDKNNISTLYNKVIVIVGESVNKHHMGLYGYNSNTTPFLSSLKKNKNLFTFNVIAPTNQTRYSVPILLTKANVEDYVNLYTHSHSIIKDFYMKGYTTSWISNQGHVGKHDNSISLIGQEADKRVFFNKGDYRKAKTDDSVVDYLNKHKLNSDKELSIIHLMGSHFDYTKRYTKEHMFFNKPKNVIEEYDNSIYFTDYVLENIYKYYSKDEKVLFIYFSDHGEVMADDGNINKIGGHGFNPAYKEEYEVPFVIYSSIDNPRLNKLLEKNKEHYFNMENLNYMIEYISGIREDDNVSYSSNVFTLEPKNIIDYEKLKYYQ